MKKTFTLKLDTELTIDFSQWGLSDAEQRGGCETKALIINHLLEETGVDEFEIEEKNHLCLFESMAHVVKAQNDYYLRHKHEY